MIEHNQNDGDIAIAIVPDQNDSDISIAILTDQNISDVVNATLANQNDGDIAIAIVPDQNSDDVVEATLANQNDDDIVATEPTQEDGDIVTANLPKQITKALTRMGYVTFTEVQKLTIPLALKGKDILGSAQTGTGKTAAFAVPLAAKLLENEDQMALIVTPTRELAQQVYKVFMQILEFTDIRSSLLIGGDSIELQIRQLKYKPRVIIGTPGRINDHLERRTLSLKKACYLVLDETDRMLDMGFGIQINNIIPHMAEKKQTLLFSATLSTSIEKLANKYLTNPERIAVGESNTIVANIDQQAVFLKESEKFEKLLSELTERQGSIIVFVRTKHSADRLADRLKDHDHNACAIHGDLRQNKRERVMHRFRTKKHRILVATDVAARGLDIPHIEHVINYDLTQAPEDYIHRLGRTARAGAKGSAISFISDAEKSKWRDIQRLLDPTNKSHDYPLERSGGSSSRPSSSRGGFSRGPRQGNDSRGGFDSRRGDSRGGFDSRGPRPGNDSRGGFDSRSPRPGNDSRGSFDSRGPRPGNDSRGSFDSRGPRPGNDSRGGFDSRRDDGQRRTPVPEFRHSDGEVGRNFSGENVSFAAPNHSRPRVEGAKFKPRGFGSSSNDFRGPRSKPAGESSTDFPGFKPRAASGSQSRSRSDSAGNENRFGRTARPANNFSPNRGRRFGTVNKKP